MITVSRAFSRPVMDGVVRQTRPFVGNGQKWVLVSVYTGEENSWKFLTKETAAELARQGMNEGISLMFWDITDDAKRNAQILRPDDRPVFFNEEMAKAIVDLVDRTIMDPEPVMFVAHCDAGKSRSGAIALFAAERAGLDIGEFFSLNTKVDPNPFVLRTLRKVAGMEYVPMSAAEAAAQEASGLGFA